MAERGSEIGATVCLGALSRVRPKPVLVEKRQVPEPHGPALVEGKGQIGRPGGRMRGGQAEQIGLDRNGIVSAQRCVRGIRKSRIEMGAVLRNPAMKRADEIIIAPGSDAGLAVGGNVGGIDRAEGELERNPTRKWLAPRNIMAGGAIGSAREIFAARDQLSRRTDVRHRRIGIVVDQAQTTHDPTTAAISTTTPRNRRLGPSSTVIERVPSRPAHTQDQA